MHFRIKKCDIFIDYAFILVLSLAAVFNSRQVIYLLLFSALHEIGHLTALLICKEKPYKIHLSYYVFNQGILFIDIAFFPLCKRNS